MRRSLVKNLSLQTATLTDDGLQVKPSWTTTLAVVATLLPASKSDVELAGLRGERVTHTALLPAGLSVSTTRNRLLDGSTVFRVASVTPTPKHTVCVLEATT